MTAPTFTIGQAVIVSPPMTPCARHRGQIVRKAKHGWRVRFDAWGMMITETMPESALMRAESVTPGQLAYEADVRARIDPATLSRADAITFRESELARLESARLVAGIASGPLKRKARRATAAHHANVMALSSAIDGPMPDDIAAMTDDELLAELRQ